MGDHQPEGRRDVARHREGATTVGEESEGGMDRATRDKFASGTQKDITAGNACWETPPEVFAKLNADFGPFDIDLTADSQRRLCEAYIGPDHIRPELRDALEVDWWHHGRNGYSNPPYGPFVQDMLAQAKSQAKLGFTTTLLLPMRVTKAFQRHVLNGASELLFCDKRIIFNENGAPRINPKTGKPDPAMFDSIIVRYTPGHVGPPRVGIWEVPPHGLVKAKAA